MSHKMWSLLTLLFCYLATARVVVDPHVYIAVLRGSASFVVPPTLLGSLHGATWTLDGMVLQEGQNVAMLNIFASMITIFGVPHLNISNIPAEYNNSVVGCEAYLSNGKLVTADEAILRLQGPLAAVVSLTLEVLNSTIFLTWHPPVTLDIRGLEPDITYRVAIVGLNVRGDETLLFHECDITETHFDHPLPHRLSWCYNIYANVTPVNPAGYGESVVKPWNITDQSPVLVPPPTYDLGMTEIELIMSAPVCTAELVFVDLDTGESITLKDTDLTVEENSITFTTDLLTADRYNATIRASNAAGSSISYFNISVPAGTVMQHDYEVTTQPFRGSGLLDREDDEKEDDEKGRKLPLIGVLLIIAIGILIGARIVFNVCLCKHKCKASPKKNLVNGCSSGGSEHKKKDDRQVTDDKGEIHGACIVQGSSVYQRSLSHVNLSTTWLSQTTENIVMKETHTSPRSVRTINHHDSEGAEPTKEHYFSAMLFSAQTSILIDGDDLEARTLTSVEVHNQAAIQRPIGSLSCPALFDTNRKMICGGDCDGSSTALRQQPPPESVQFSIGVPDEEN